MSLLDVLGLIGVAVIVVSYLLLQTERMRFDDWSYLLLNAGGALAIILSLTVDFNLSAIVVEGFWLLITVFGIAKKLRAG